MAVLSFVFQDLRNQPPCLGGRRTGDHGWARLAQVSACLERCTLSVSRNGGVVGHGSHEIRPSPAPTSVWTALRLRRSAFFTLPASAISLMGVGAAAPPWLLAVDLWCPICSIGCVRNVGAPNVLGYSSSTLALANVSRLMPTVVCPGVTPSRLGHSSTSTPPPSAAVSGIRSRSSECPAGPPRPLSTRRQ